MNKIISCKKRLDNRTLLPLDSLVWPSWTTRRMHSVHFIPPYTCTNIYKFSFVSCTIVNWNALPQRAVHITGDTRFNIIVDCCPSRCMYIIVHLRGSIYNKSESNSLILAEHCCSQPAITWVLMNTPFSFPASK